MLSVNFTDGFDLVDALGGPGETPIVGDFNGDGFDDIGVYRPNGTTSAFWGVKLKDSAAGIHSSSFYVAMDHIGGEGEIPFVGDFN
ncbi:MAG: hypothetical protein WD229_13740, partial [Pirellulales bacterium]